MTAPHAPTADLQILLDRPDADVNDEMRAPENFAKVVTAIPGGGLGGLGEVQASRGCRQSCHGLHRDRITSAGGTSAGVGGALRGVALFVPWRPRRPGVGPR